MSQSPASSTKRTANLALGFTLIELLITVAIISILATIALPAYRDYITQSRVADATAALASKRARLELSYDNASPHTYVGAPDCAVDNTTSTFFTFSCTTATDTEYVISAVGKSAMAGFTFTIDQNNAKATTSAGSGWSTNSTCWVTGRSGSC